MATEVLSFPINLRMNANKFSAAYQKYFAETDKREPLNLKGFAKPRFIHLLLHAKLHQVVMK